jgi:hypothetical protein
MIDHRVMVAAAVVGLALGCSTASHNSNNTCRTSADCTGNGVCLPDGTCSPDVDASMIDAPPPIDSPPRCGNKDGTISREEFPLDSGREAMFRVGVDATVDTAGTLQPDGTRTWDLSGVLSDDRDVAYKTKPLEGLWYADEFPTATFSARLNTKEAGVEALFGVYEATDTALRLLGVVSKEPGLNRTELKYDPPVEVLRFPIEPSMTWSAGTRVSGYVTLLPSPILPAGYRGFVVPYPERYDMTVDASGTLEAPGGSLPVLRIYTFMKRTITIPPYDYIFIRRTHQFVSECIGTVGNLVSEWGEDEVEFTKATEAWRVGP